LKQVNRGSYWGCGGGRGEVMQYKLVRLSIYEVISYLKVVRTIFRPNFHKRILVPGVVWAVGDAGVEILNFGQSNSLVLVESSPMI
jgi:hypothetical protein